MTETFTSEIYRLDKLKLFHVTVSRGVLEKFFQPEDESTLFNQRFVIRINDQIEWSCGTVPLGDDTAYITISSKRMKDLGVHEGDRVQVALTKDNSEYGLDVPEEFEIALEQDPEAKRRFEQLTKGKRRAIIYMVTQFKTTDKKIEKSWFFLENLKRMPEGKFSFRALIGKEERE